MLSIREKQGGVERSCPQRKINSQEGEWWEPTVADAV
jgi:hypothetical protein